MAGYGGSSVHDIGPWWVVIKYTVQNRVHYHTVSFASSSVVVVGETPDCTLRDATTQSIEAAVGDYIDRVRAIFTPDASFVSFDVLHKALPGDQPTWINTLDLGPVVGSWSAGIVNLAGQISATFRTSHGGKWRLQFMESGIVSEATYDIPAILADPRLAPLHNYVTGGKAWMVGHDGGYPVATRRYMGKENNKLRRSWF